MGFLKVADDFLMFNFPNKINRHTQGISFFF